MNGHAVDAGRDDYGIDDDRAGSTNLVTVVRRRIDGRYPIDPFGGDPHIRPMKDRVREAVFNLLAEDVRGRQVIDVCPDGEPQLAQP